MKVERVTTVNYTFQDGDIVAYKLGAGAIVALYLRIHKNRWYSNDALTGVLDSDIQSNLDNHSDKWRYVGNKYEVFQ